MNRIFWISVLTFLTLCDLTSLWAQELDKEVLPSPELIEFLGAFEDEDAGWIDPLELLAMDEAELDDLQKQEEDSGK